VVVAAGREKTKGEMVVKGNTRGWKVIGRENSVKTEFRLRWEKSQKNCPWLERPV